MTLLNNNLDDFTLFIIIFATSFFASFSKELNDKAKNNETFILFISEIFLNGISGIIMSIIVAKFICNDILVIIGSSFTGGIFGERLLRILISLKIKAIAKDKDTDLEERKKK